MKAIVFLLALLSLAACGGGSGDPTTIVDTSRAMNVKCADVHNSDTTSRCEQAASASITDWIIGRAHAAMEVDVGAVLRGGPLVTSRVDIDNPFGTERTVFVEMRFDANCAGQPGDWVVLTKQPVDVEPNSVLPHAVGGMCGDMPLGPRTMTTTVWDSDGTTVIDFAVVRFTLVD